MSKAKKIKIAIVGIGFRLPNDTHTFEKLWNVLSSGGNLISTIDPDRFDYAQYFHARKTESGKSYTFKAGTLSNIYDFDAQFFGISPREAVQMDPQQKLLLETTWEALEQGGQNIDQLRGQPCAVYVGIGSNENSYQYSNDCSLIDSYMMTGNCSSIAANRLSYFFNFTGPSMSIDTACSSSLVALHQACESIRSGVVPMAIAAGVNLLQSPASFIGFSKASMLSPDGQCKSFSAEANGYVRSEGCVVLFLKSLKQAQRDGDFIHGVILNTGVNNDGKTNGIVLPSADAQATLISRVHEQVGIAADNITYIEAHGTGTLAGDQAESRGLYDSIGKNRSKNPLLIGSIKSNLGHLEVASGLTGILKIILCLRHKKIPKTLHFDKPNPNIPFDEMKLKVVNEMTNIPIQTDPVIMGVNSFGFGGTNAHVLLQENISKENLKPNKKNLAPPLFLTLHNGKNEITLLRQYAELIRAQPERYYDIAYSLWKRKAKQHHGIAIYGDTPELILSVLEQAVNDGIYTSQIISQERIGTDLSVALIYSGNGSQWQGMGAELITSDPIFKKTIHEIDALFSVYADYSIKSELLASLENSRYDQTEIAQPCLFALQVATTRYLRYHGIKIHAVMGHSVGEIAAAWASGALTLAQATEIIYQRSFWQGKTCGQGRMMAFGLSADNMQAMILSSALEEKVYIAAINSSEAVTIAGELSALHVLQTICEEKFVFNKLLDLDYAFHTPAMDPIKDNLIQSLKTLKPIENNITFISTVTGSALSGKELNAQYWWKNIREPVQFCSAIETLIKEGGRIFIEVGPHPVLKSYIETSLKSCNVCGAVFSTGKRKANQLTELNNGLFRTWLSGACVNASHFFPIKGKNIALPPQIWSKEHFRLSPSLEDKNQINLSIDHPLLGCRIKKNESVWENHLDTSLVSYLNDHVVNDTAILPAAAFCEMALAASREYYKNQEQDLRDLDIISPMVFEAGQTRQVRFELQGNTGDFVIKSRLRHHDDWIVHAVGRVIPEPALIVTDHAHKMPTNACNVLEGQTLYQIAQSVGLTYGPLFQAISTFSIRKNEADATLQLSSTMKSYLQSHCMYPGIVDACFQLLVGLLAFNSNEKQTFLPIRIGRLALFAPLEDELKISAHIVKKNKQSILANFFIYNKQDQILARISDCRFKKTYFTEQANLTTCVVKPYLLSAFEKFPTLTFSDIEKIQSQFFFKRHDHSVNTDRADNFVSLLNTMIVRFIYDAIVALTLKNSFSTDSLIAEANIASSQIPYLHWSLEILQNQGLLQINANNRYVFNLENNVADPALIWKQLLNTYPNYLNELLLAGRTGLHFKSILTKKESDEFQLVSLFKQDSINHFVENASFTSMVNDSIFSLFSALLEKISGRGKIRILDVGYGVGALSARLINLCEKYQVEYVLLVKDNSAAGSFNNSCLKINTLTGNAWINDLEEISIYPFDIILIRNHLHTVQAISEHLTLLKKCLKTQGVLLLSETPNNYLQNFVLGLEPSWWRCTDNNQICSPLLSANEWRQQLENVGFLVPQPLAECRDVASFFLVGYVNESTDIMSPTFENKTDVLQFMFSDNAAALVSKLNLSTPLVVPAELSDDEFLEFFNHILRNHNQSKKSVRILCWISDTTLMESAKTCGIITALLKSITVLNWLVFPQLTVLTQNAIAVSSVASISQPAQSVIWGFVRVIQNEYKNLQCKLIDIQGSLTDALIKNLFTEINLKDDEQEIIVNEHGRYGFKVQKIQPFVEAQTGNQDYFLDFKRAGSLKNLSWSVLDTNALLPDEVRVKPYATGLNFRDLMYAMGLIPDEAVENGFLGATLGMEFAGSVLAVGEAITQFKIGDRVMGFAPASFSTMTVTKEHAITYLPEKWSYEEAATIPIAFFTAYYALHHLAHLRPGERILIHGAAGGVGIAAIQIANHIGATVFATTGSLSKQDFLKLTGVTHRYDSRSLKFADEILRDTQGEGVDVVLNCLAGEAITANLSIIKPFGRFLELGKRDFFANSKMGLRPFRNNISYFGIDADQLLIHNPVLCTTLFKEMMQLFKNNSLMPLPYHIFNARQIDEAFRYMQQSRHIGKIVVKVDKSELLERILQSRKIENLTLVPHATYLVTGGCGGFGLETAKWLAKKGARHLVLVGRSQTVSDETRDAIDQLQNAGVTVTIYPCDVSDFDAVKKMITAFTAHAFPLRGIIHAAAIYDDGLIENLNTAKIEAVLKPKAMGAWNLHVSTEKLTLDFFVVYSSVTTLFGNPGQANYVSANTYLENLMQYRHAYGLPGLFIAWGPIADAGYLTRHKKIKDMLVNKLGDRLLTTSDAFDFLEKLIGSHLVGVAIAHLNFRRMLKSVPTLLSPKFHDVINPEDLLNNLPSDSAEDVRGLIESKTAHEATVIIGDLLSQEIAQILRLPVEKLDKKTPLNNYGMDSLVGVELAHAIEDRFCIQMPMMSLSQNVTVDAISARILELLLDKQNQNQSELDNAIEQKVDVIV